jgi:hypothetical protein
LVILHPDTARRLAFVRLLLSRAQEESRLAAPFSYDSLNRLHDAAEMFLTLAVQTHHKAVPKDFMKYWDALEESLGRPLLYRAQAERFNKARVAWKHFGAEPAAAEIGAARTTVEGLLADECHALFGVDLADVSLTAFIRPQDARDLAESAEQAWAAGEEVDAFADLVDAFDVLLKDYESRKMVAYNRSVFGPNRNFTFLSGFFQGMSFGKARDFVDGVIEMLTAHDRNIKIIGFGLDFRRYGKFDALTPHLQRNVGGGRITSERERSAARTQEDFEFCRDFVVSSAIHLAEFDYDIDQSAFSNNTFTVQRRRPMEPDEQSDNAGEAADPA